MRTEHLEYLLDLQKTLSMTKTAENYFTSHQVINNAIKALEEELDIAILNRTHKGVSFTEAGLLVYEYAKKIQIERSILLNQLSPHICRYPTSLHGNLAVYTIPRFSNKQFLKFYTAYCQKNRKLSVNLKTLSASHFFTLLPLPENFIFLTTAHTATFSTNRFQDNIHKHNLTYQIIKKQTLGFCIAKTSKWMQDIQNYSDIEAKFPFPIVVYNYSLEENELLSSNQYSELFLADNFEIQKQLIKTGDYVGIVSRTEFQHFFQSKDHSIVFVENSTLGYSYFYYIAIYPEANQTDPVITDFLATLQKFYN